MQKNNEVEDGQHEKQRHAEDENRQHLTGSLGSAMLRYSDSAFWLVLGGMAVHTAIRLTKDHMNKTKSKSTDDQLNPPSGGSTVTQEHKAGMMSTLFSITGADGKFGFADVMRLGGMAIAAKVGLSSAGVETPSLSSSVKIGGIFAASFALIKTLMEVAKKNSTPEEWEKTTGPFRDSMANFGTHLGPLGSPVNRVVESLFAMEPKAYAGLSDHEAGRMARGIEEKLSVLPAAVRDTVENKIVTEGSTIRLNSNRDKFTLSESSAVKTYAAEEMPVEIAAHINRQHEDLKHLHEKAKGMAAVPVDKAADILKPKLRQRGDAMSVLKLKKTKSITEGVNQRPETAEKKDQQKAEFDKLYLLAVAVSREVKKIPGL
ncbi:MAG: hypothetical protein KJ900_05550 [Proteobacteria bacterium]|nr:hypothetical protein [Desulfocapsa sp.]MBU3944905.1 hypothetical protein [Pseudomonadota bacterium]MBU4411539.1 hypothetical protein [Actinomycetota bacterium]MCG2744940.1 hypothetical protein [Desulfobacteraceae bacterium]MBU4027551.1 hypothetical protein [Pseudomonadota bacterium]